jgi:hypothetical protein
MAWQDHVAAQRDARRSARSAGVAAAARPCSHLRRLAIAFFVVAGALLAAGADGAWFACFGSW